MFADDTFGQSFKLGFGVVVFVAVHEHNQVGILFDGAGFAQVGHHRAFVGTLFHRAAQLRQGDDGNLQLFGQGFERTGDFTQFGGAVVGAAGTRHQLQVVDDNQPEFASELSGQPARPRPKFERGQAGGFVDKHRSVGQLDHRFVQTAPMFVLQTPCFQNVLIEPADRAEHTHDQLCAAHLH